MTDEHPTARSVRDCNRCVAWILTAPCICLRECDSELCMAMDTKPPSAEANAREAAERHADALVPATPGDVVSLPHDGHSAAVDAVSSEPGAVDVGKVPDEVDATMLVTVDPADLLTVLEQKTGHSHERPGIWDASNPPWRANLPCVECAARERLRAALATAIERWTLRYSQPVMRIDGDGEPVSPTGEEGR